MLDQWMQEIKWINKKRQSTGSHEWWPWAKETSQTFLKFPRCFLIKWKKQLVFGLNSQLLNVVKILIFFMNSDQIIALSFMFVEGEHYLQWKRVQRSGEGYGLKILILYSNMTNFFLLIHNSIAHSPSLPHPLSFPLPLPNPLLFHNWLLYKMKTSDYSYFVFYLLFSYCHYHH